MHLLLLIPSSLLLILLFAHCWHYRGRQAALTFFGACFAFGVLRGNLIHAIITRYLAGETLPYLFTRPVVKIGYASLQECVGWIFALYLSWSIAERLLAGGSRNSASLFRVIGLSSFLMGAIAYAVETAAAAVQWWVWVIPVRNPFFYDVPLAGIIAWISVGFDFLGPFLLLYYGGYTHRARYLLLALFPVHMLCHMKVTHIAAWMPMNPAEIWHWLMLCALIYGLAAGGPALAVPPGSGQDRAKPLVRYAVWGTAGGFVLVLLTVFLLVVRSPGLLISLLPFITILLSFSPLYAVCFCTGACLFYGLVTSGWTYTLVPLGFLLIFPAGSLVSGKALSSLWTRRIAAGVLTVLTVLLYFQFRARFERYSILGSLSQSWTKEISLSESEAIWKRLPSPHRPEDALYYCIYSTRLLRRDCYQAAIRLIEEGLACDSAYADLYFNQGWAYRQTNNLTGAIKAYEKGLELNPVDFGSYLFLGQLYEYTGSPDKAEKLYRRALEYNNKLPEMVLALEGVLYRQNRLEEAVKLLRDNIPVQKDTLKLVSRLAADLLKMGRYRDAEVLYLGLVKSDVRQVYEASTKLALMYWKDRANPGEALRYVNLAAAVKPTAEIFTLKGTILESMGHAEEAHSAFRRAAELANQPASPRPGR